MYTKEELQTMEKQKTALLTLRISQEKIDDMKSRAESFGTSLNRFASVLLDSGLVVADEYLKKLGK